MAHCSGEIKCHFGTLIGGLDIGRAEWAMNIPAPLGLAITVGALASE
jgi:hypothetical protein